MNKKFKLGIFALIVLIITGTIVFLFNHKSYALEEVSGTFGDCAWLIDSSGKLTINPQSGNSCTLNNMTSTNSAPWYNSRKSITEVEIKSGVSTNESANYMFYELENAESINIEELNTSSATSMTGMFQNCKKLKTINLSNFNTSNTTNMDYMFENCFMLEELDLSSFDMSRVTKLTTMTTLIGKNNKQGCKLVLNNTIKVKFHNSIMTGEFNLPWGYYAKEENGTLSENIYNVNELKNAVQNSNQPTSWIPAYQLRYIPTDSIVTVVGSPNPKTMQIGTKIDTTGYSIDSEGHTLKGWRNNDTFIEKNAKSDISYGDNYSEIGILNGNMYLYTALEGNSYTLTIDPTGGTISGANGWTKNSDKFSKTIKYNDLYGQLPTPKKDNYSFIGWYTDQNNGELISANHEYIETSNQTLYAHWIEGEGQGISGDCNWKIDENGMLTIFPSENPIDEMTANSSTVKSKDNYNICDLGEAEYDEENDDYVMPWYKYRNEITSVKVNKYVIANNNSANLFKGLHNAKTVDLSNLMISDTENVSNYLKGVGSNLKSGTKIIFNNTFSQICEQSIQRGASGREESEGFSDQYSCDFLKDLPWNYYAKEKENNTLNNQLYTKEDLYSEISGIEKFDFEAKVNYVSYEYEYFRIISNNLDSNWEILSYGESICTFTNNICSFSGPENRYDLNSFILYNKKTKEYHHLTSSFSPDNGNGGGIIKSMDESNMNGSFMYKKNESSIAAEYKEYKDSYEDSYAKFISSNYNNYQVKNYANKIVCVFENGECNFSDINDFWSYLNELYLYNPETGVEINLNYNPLYEENKWDDEGYYSSYGFFASSDDSSQIETITLVPAYSITYDKNNGNTISGTPNPKVVRIGTNIDTTGYSATKEGLTLNSWNTDPLGAGKSFKLNILSDTSYGNKYNASGLVKGNITLYAQYVTNNKTNNKKVTISYISGKKILSKSEIGYGDTVKLMSLPTKRGYKATGWLINNKLYKPGDTIKITDNLKIKAIYTKKKSVLSIINPSTGDNIIKYMIALCLSGIIITSIVVYRIKNKKQEETDIIFK